MILVFGIIHVQPATLYVPSYSLKFESQTFVVYLEVRCTKTDDSNETGLMNDPNFEIHIARRWWTACEVTLEVRFGNRALT